MIFIKKVISNLYERHVGNFFFKQKGFCPCCEHEVYFISHNNWLRDHFKCNYCSCIPRERALMVVIEKLYPNWKNLDIHESSPGKRGHSLKLMKYGKKYVTTQFFSGKGAGEYIDGTRNENLEHQTFNDEEFDIVVTSDVMEHIYEPQLAFKEIYRTLKPGGAHIFSVPLINKHYKTQRWATQGINGEPNFLFSPEWHGNPINPQGSPVTFHWGYDIKNYIENLTGDQCEIFALDDLKNGIRAEYIDIVVAKKSRNES